MTMSASLPAPTKPPRPSLPTDRYWKLDYAKLALPQTPADATPPTFTIANAAIAQGVVLCTLADAQRNHPQLVARGLNNSVADDETRFTLLASEGDATCGFFCYVPPNVQVVEPLKITLGGSGSWFGRGIIVVDSGAQVTIDEENATVLGDTAICGIIEIVLADQAALQYTAVQDCATTARSFFTRRATVAAQARLRIATAELGASLSQSYVDAVLEAPGAHAEITAIALADAERYLDLGNDLVHAEPNTSSQTVVKVVAFDHTRGRYYGNIRIKAHAHGADAILRDDTLLLSPDAHIDSVPALEISANDVKAFHGATVGSVDAEQLFYAMSRGLTKVEAERMITLGFLEPAIARFPHEVVREFLRSQLVARIGS